MAGRPKGFHPWKPQPHVLEVIENVEGILVEYEPYLPLTVRQIFYRLVGQYGYDKTELAYKRLCDYIVRARRAQRLSFGSIRDDGTSAEYAGGFDEPNDFWKAEEDAAADYTRDRMFGQPRKIEVWCEAAGMAPQLAKIAQPYGITVYSTGGFSSVTVTKRIAERALQAGKDTLDDDGNVIAPGVSTTFLHIGDYDPSGQSIYEAMSEDASKFVDQLRDYRNAPAALIEPVRVALTEQQVTEYDLPTAPPKPTDTRSAKWEGETCQAEAMPPSTLGEILKAAILERLNKAQRDRVLREEREERSVIVRRMAANLHALNPAEYPYSYGFPLA